MDTQEIIATLDGFQDVENEKQLDEMVESVLKLYDSPRPEAAESLFLIFERFPEEDGCETFWSILHTLERTPDYEQELVKSVMRQPDEFNVLMINRMLNGGIYLIGDTDLIDLLRRVENDERTPASVRKRAIEFIQRHET